MIKTIQKIVKSPLRLFYFLAGKIYNQDARIARRLYDYFPTYRSAFCEVMNQVYRIFRKPLAYEIRGIILEPTNHCNLRCRHCTTQKITNDEKRYMRLELFKKIIDDNPQLTCLILTRNGEPLLHPDVFDMISYARNKEIYVLLYTNGMQLDDEKINKVFESDLSELNFSLEGTDEYYRHIRHQDYAKIEGIMKKVLEERDRRESPMKIGINTTIYEDPAHAETVRKAWGEIVDHIDVEPLMGMNSALRHSPCKTLWRNLVVTCDGIVLPCCVDMEGHLIMGNVNEQSLRDVVNGPKAKRFRKMHVEGNYPSICKYCDPHWG